MFLTNDRSYDILTWKKLKQIKMQISFSKPQKINSFLEKWKKVVKYHNFFFIIPKESNIFWLFWSKFHLRKLWCFFSVVWHGITQQGTWNIFVSNWRGKRQEDKIFWLDRRIFPLAETGWSEKDDKNLRVCCIWCQRWCLDLGHHGKPSFPCGVWQGWTGRRLPSHELQIYLEGQGI